MIDAAHLDAVLLRLLEACGPGRSISPADVARALADDPAADTWQRHLGDVRRAALRLAEAGRIDILRKGRPVPPAEMRGVVRLRLRAPDAG